ncbi:CU044_5270 family protein [Frankia sp. CNm7]|uniref:CU044_5270 family protein n=2 Tax=Frankia nepalensis TaxID=1836974 RepID=A0A937RHT5_9ACTN|nr:CU044_5270 family protein [Frankia nepalensis]MBL7510917.1 CU044_5270 family protein [Frankia nepalensis]MBL7522800.1 CU044_5270 family protein [Frankia nepalensis]MBL7630417.1 CU044_5270 family protein [Frankia nepalensis]
MSDRDDRGDIDDLVVVRALLSASNPVADGPLSALEQRRGEHLLALLLADTSARSHRPGRRPGRGAALRRRGVLTAAATVLVIASALVGLTTVRTHDRATATPLLPEPLLTATTGDHDRAVAALSDAARRQRGSAQAGTGPVLYARSQTYGLDVAIADHKSTTTARTTITDLWRDHDGTVRTDRYIQQVDRAGGDIGGPTPADDDRFEGRSDRPPAPPEFDPALTPTDPAQLLARLKARATADGYPIDLTVAHDVLSALRSGLTSPAQNAALYDVLATIPGVFDMGPVRDHAGRPGHAVGLVVSDQSSLSLAIEYVIFSDTGAPLTIEQVAATPPPGLRLPPVPTVESYTEIITTRRVPTVGATT